MPEREELHVETTDFRARPPSALHERCGVLLSRFARGVSGLAESLAKFGRNDDPSDSKSKLCCFLDRRGPSGSVIQSDQICIGPKVGRR